MLHLWAPPIQVVAHSKIWAFNNYFAYCTLYLAAIPVIWAVKQHQGCSAATVGFQYINFDIMCYRQLKVQQVWNIKSINFSAHRNFVLKNVCHFYWKPEQSIQQISQHTGKLCRKLFWLINWFYLLKRETRKSCNSLSCCRPFMSHHFDS